MNIPFGHVHFPPGPLTVSLEKKPFWKEKPFSFKKRKRFSKIKNIIMIKKRIYPKTGFSSNTVSSCS